MRLPKVYKRTRRNDYYENTKKQIQKEQEISQGGQKPL